MYVLVLEVSFTVSIKKKTHDFHLFDAHNILCFLHCRYDHSNVQNVLVQFLIMI